MGHCTRDKLDFQIFQKTFKRRDNFCFPVKDYYIKLGFDFNKESFEISGSEFINGYMNRVHEMPLHSDAVDMLRTAKGLGITQSLLSASSQVMLDDSLKFHEINSFFNTS